MTTLRCETCSHWQPADRLTAYAAPCALASYPGRVTFDMSCPQHSSAPQPAPQDQSNARGIVQMWQARP